MELAAMCVCLFGEFKYLEDLMTSSCGHLFLASLYGN